MCSMGEVSNIQKKALKKLKKFTLRTRDIKALHSRRVELHLTKIYVFNDRSKENIEEKTFEVALGASMLEEPPNTN